MKPPLKIKTDRKEIDFEKRRKDTRQSKTSKEGNLTMAVFSKGGETTLI